MSNTKDYKITADDVRLYREVHECSLFEAKNALEKERCLTMLDAAETVEDLKPVIEYLLIKRGAPW